MRKFVILAATTLSVLAGTLASSEAMPLAPAGAVAAPAAVENVAYGCGPYAHPNPYGRCVPNHRRPMMRRYYVERPRCMLRRDYYGRVVRVCRR